MNMTSLTSGWRHGKSTVLSMMRSRGREEVGHLVYQDRGLGMGGLYSLR